METVVVIKKEDYERIPYIKEMEAYNWIWKEEKSLHPGCYVFHVTEMGKELLDRDD